MTPLAFLICIFVTASFVDTHRYNDYDVPQQDENVMQLLHILDDNEYSTEKRRNVEESENWHGRWTPDRPGDPKPLPEVLTKNQQGESVAEPSGKTHWLGRWMPDRPDDPKPPPKVLPKNQQDQSVAEPPDETHWLGRWMPDRLGDPKPPPKVLPKNQQYESVAEPPDETHWSGRWMPDRPDDPKPPSKVLPKNQQYEYESVMEFPHEMYMGHVSPDCDDAKTNLSIDWDHTPAEYTCYGHNIEPSHIIRPRIYCENIPKMYKAAHKCMNQRIEYDDDIPLYGPHRPLWPVYGEYEFLPKQRWLHSLEHGAIVMLYHPCANPLEVERLKSLVKKCLWRHVITPYSYLDARRPLALLSWGCRLTMSYSDPTVVNYFIRKKAIHGPERNGNDGQFADGLLSRSNIVTDRVDSMLCPNT